MLRKGKEGPIWADLGKYSADPSSKGYIFSQPRGKKIIVDMSCGERGESCGMCGNPDNS